MHVPDTRERAAAVLFSLMEATSTSPSRLPSAQDTIMLLDYGVARYNGGSLLARSSVLAMSSSIAAFLDT